MDGGQQAQRGWSRGAAAVPANPSPNFGLAVVVETRESKALHREGRPELLRELLAPQISGSVRAASGPAAARPTHKAKAKRQRLLLSLLTGGWRYQLKSAAGRFSANKRRRLPRHPVIEMQSSAAAASRGSRDKVTQEKQIHRGALRGQRCHLGLPRTAGRLPGAAAAPTPLLSPPRSSPPALLLSPPRSSPLLPCARSLSRSGAGRALVPPPAGFEPLLHPQVTSARS